MDPKDQKKLTEILTEEEIEELKKLRDMADQMIRTSDKLLDKFNQDQQPDKK